MVKMLGTFFDLLTCNELYVCKICAFGKDSAESVLLSMLNLQLFFYIFNKDVSHAYQNTADFLFLLTSSMHIS